MALTRSLAYEQAHRWDAAGIQKASPKKRKRKNFWEWAMSNSESDDNEEQTEEQEKGLLLEKKEEEKQGGRG